MMDNMVIDYTYLLKDFGEERIADRCDWLNDLMIIFIESNNLKDEVCISKRILNHVVIDYFADIRRLKDFQNIERTNTIKIFSYIIYWIIRHKPLQLIREVSEEQLFVNEKFSLDLIRMYIFDNPDNVPIKKDKEECVNEFLQTLFYYFKYRDVNPQCIELVLLSFEAGRGYQYSADYRE